MFLGSLVSCSSCKSRDKQPRANVVWVLCQRTGLLTEHTDLRNRLFPLCGEKKGLTHTVFSPYMRLAVLESKSYFSLERPCLLLAMPVVAREQERETDTNSAPLSVMLHVDISNQPFQ